MSDETGHERPDSSKIKTTVLQVMLVAPWRCARQIIICDWKNCCEVFIVYKIKMIGMLLLHVNVVHRQVQNRKQKHVTERYSRLHNHSNLLSFSQTQETLKLKGCVHNCVIRCHQSWLRSQATNLETQKRTKRVKIHQSQITNHDLLNPFKKSSVS